MRITKLLLMMTGVLGVLIILSLNTHVVLGQKDQKGKYAKGGAGEKNAPKTVNLTVENQSGKKVLIVLNRYAGPDLYFAWYLDDKEMIKDYPIAGEWRPVVVWEQDSPHVIQPGWAKGHHFQKDTTITIRDKTLDIK